MLRGVGAYTIVIKEETLMQGKVVNPRHVGAESFVRRRQ